MATEVTMDSNDGKVWGGGNQPLGASYGKLMMWFFLLSDALTFSGFLTGYGLYRFKYQESWPIAENVFTHFPFIHGDHPLLYVALMTFILIMSSVTMVLAVTSGHHGNKKGVVLWLFLTIVGGLIFVGSQAWEWYHFIVGDKGAIMLEDGRIAHFEDMDGNRVALRDLVHGEGSHGDHHERFDEARVIGAFRENTDIGVRFPGKKGEFVNNSSAGRFIEDIEVVQGANMRRNEYGTPLFANFFFFITGFHGFHVFSGVIINLVIFINVVMGTYERRGHYDMVEKVGLYWHFVDLVWVFVFTFFYLV